MGIPTQRLDTPPPATHPIPPREPAGTGITHEVAIRKKEIKKSFTMRACEGHRVLSGYAALYWKGGSLIEGN